MHAAIQSVTVKEEVDLQNRGLFVSTTSEAFFRSFIAIFSKKDKREKVFSFRYSRERSQRISASTRLSSATVYANDFCNDLFPCSTEYSNSNTLGYPRNIAVSLEYSVLYGFFVMWEYSPRVRFPHQRSSSDLPHLKQQSSEKNEVKRKREKKETHSCNSKHFFPRH